MIVSMTLWNFDFSHFSNMFDRWPIVFAEFFGISFVIMPRNLSISTIFKSNLKIKKFFLSQNRVHFRNLWEKQMQIDTHIIDVTDDDFIDIIDNDKVHDFCPGTMLWQDTRVSLWLTKKQKVCVLRFFTHVICLLSAGKFEILVPDRNRTRSTFELN